MQFSLVELDEIRVGDGCRAMADKILDFLRYGAPPTSISSLSPSAAAPFLPSLALLASDAPSLTTPLLTPLLSNPDTPQAFTYASLDYSHISQSVLDAEAAADGALPTLDREADEFDLSRGHEESAEIDESVTFETASEEERVKLAIVSLRKRAREFSKRIENGGDPGNVWCQQQKDEGSLWESDICLPELLCLLPIASLRCPMVLLPEHIVRGLLTARWGFLLLFSILINHPLVVSETLFLLSKFVSSHQDIFDRHLSTSSESSVIILSAQPTPHPLPKHQLSKKAGEPALHTQGQANVIVVRSMEQALLTLLRLSKISASMAFMCREALVRNCASAALVLYMTSEFIHDELDFLSRMIFSAQKTSEWMLSYLRTSQKESLCPLAPLIETVELMTEPSSSGAEDVMLSPSRDDSCSHRQGAAYHLRKALLADAQVIRKKYGWCGQLCAHLRLYCVLIRAAEMQPMHEEMEFWLKSFCCEFETYPSEISTNHLKGNGFWCERTLQLGMSFFCLVPGLTGASTRALFHKCLAVLFKLNISEGFDQNSVSELAVWLAVQLLLRRFSDIAMVVREALGMHVTVHNALMRELHDAAVAAEIISEPSSLVKAVAALRPEGPISNKTKHGCLSLKCMEQLLSSSHFLRYGIDVFEAVSHCISVSVEPLHPLLFQIIQSYAEAPAVNLQSKPGSQTFRLLPLSRSFLEDSLIPMPSFRAKTETNVVDLKIFTANRRIRAILASYYMLCREFFLRNMGVEAGYESSESVIFSSTDSEESWWSSLLDRIPFRQLICYMEKNWSDFELLFPQWLSLASVLFPERLHVSVLLEDLTEAFDFADACVKEIPTSDNLEWAGFLTTASAGAKDPLHELIGNKATDISGNAVILTSDLTKKMIEKAVQEPLPSLQILSFLNGNFCIYEEKCEKEVLELQALVVKELVPRLLDMQCSRCLQEEFCAWWSGLTAFMRHTLIPVFVEATLDMSHDSQANNDGMGVMSAQIKDLVSSLEYKNARKSYNDLVQEPLTILACKLEVYRTPVLSVFLDVLLELLTVNRRVCLGVASDGGREGNLKADEVAAALTAQDSAVCQILLEACIPRASIGDKIRPGPLLEARKAICGFLSSFLQTNHLLLKLLHFQGYPLQLIPMMVEGVPAMVQCLGFVSELLQQQQQSKQVFSIILIASIASAYSENPESLAAVQQAIAHVSFIHHNVCGSSEFLQGVLEAITQCACAFPKVATQVISILQSCVQSSGPIKRSGPPRDPVLQSAALSAFKQLIRQKVVLGEPSPVRPPFVTPNQET